MAVCAKQGPAQGARSASQGAVTFAARGPKRNKAAFGSEGTKEGKEGWGSAAAGRELTPYLWGGVGVGRATGEEGVLPSLII